MHSVKKVGQTFSIMMHGTIELINGIPTKEVAERMIKVLTKKK